MDFSKLFTLSLFSFTLAFGDDPIYHICSNSGNFTANSRYEWNLKTLTMLVIYKTPPTGFSTYKIPSTGSGNGSSARQVQDQETYGLALCRGDLSASECKTCVSEATKELQTSCPYNKGGIIWYPNCLFKYLDTDFFGKIDNGVEIYMWNTNSVDDPATFNNKTKDFLSLLAEKASINSKLYAAGEVELGISKKLYGLTQCTRDLSSVDCKNCLDVAISQLPNCCDGKQGGRVIGGSCNFRYEIYPFVKE